MTQTEETFIRAQFEKYKDTVKVFPKDFMPGDDCEEVVLGDMRLRLGSEFFGVHQVLSSKGDVVIEAPSEEYAKYYIYASIPETAKFIIPKKLKEVERVVRAYEQYYVTMLSKIVTDYNKKFDTSLHAQQVAINILQRLKMVRL